MLLSQISILEEDSNIQKTKLIEENQKHEESIQEAKS